MLTSLHLHMKNSEVCIKTRSPPASLPIQGQVTKHTTVKWPIVKRTLTKSPHHTLLWFTAKRMSRINNGNVRKDPWVGSCSSLRGWGKKTSIIIFIPLSQRLKPCITEFGLTLIASALLNRGDLRIKPFQVPANR